MRICGVDKVENIKIWGLEVLSAGELLTASCSSLESPGRWVSGAHCVEDVKHLIIDSFPYPLKEPPSVFSE